MNNYLVIGFVFLMVIRYFFTKSQNNTDVRNLKESETADNVNHSSDGNSNDEAAILDNELPSYTEKSKNTFLNPDDGFIKEINVKSNDVSIISIDDCVVVEDVSSSKENIIELDEISEAPNMPYNEKIVFAQSSKNKWLYPDDEFGKMERGRSFED
jgi:hypothetical protein